MPNINIDEAAFGGMPDDMKALAKKDETTGRYTINLVSDSFRETNVGLVKERDSLNTTLSNVYEAFGGEKDTAKLKSAFDELTGLRKKVTDKELIENSSFDRALETRTKEMQTNHEALVSGFQKTIADQKAAIEAIQSKSDASDLRYNIQLLLSHPDSEFNPAATADIVARASSVWKKNKDDKWVATNGTELLYDEAAVPLTFESWLKKLGTEVPYYLKQSAGGGAGGGRGGAGDTSSIDGMGKMSFEDYEKARNQQQYGDRGGRR